MAEQQFVNQSLPAEKIDQCDTRQERGNQNRDHRNGFEHGLAWHPATGQRIGKDESDRDGNGGGNKPDKKAVLDH